MAEHQKQRVTETALPALSSLCWVLSAPCAGSHSTDGDQGIHSRAPGFGMERMQCSPILLFMAVANSSGRVAAWCQGSWSVLLQTPGGLGSPALCVCMSTVHADTTGNTAGVITRHCLGFRQA